MDNDLRRAFTFTRLYRNIYEGLPTDKDRAAFASALFSYGLDRVQPDFGDNDTLKKAWREVLPDLDFGWTQHEQGGRGGSVTQSRKANSKPKAEKKEGKASTAAANTAPPLPPDEPPTREFIGCLEKNLLASIINSPKPLTRLQWSYLCNVYGRPLSTALLSSLEFWIDKKGNRSFWSTADHEGRSVFDILRSAAAMKTESFNRWLKDTFPAVASMDPYPLTLSQYICLRSLYGRANILVKLKQINEMKDLNLKASAFDVLRKFIDRSIKKPEGHKFHLPSHDDRPSSERVPEVKAGFDEEFPFKNCGYYIF